MSVVKGHTSVYSSSKAVIWELVSYLRCLIILLCSKQILFEYIHLPMQSNIWVPRSYKSIHINNAAGNRRLAKATWAKYEVTATKAWMYLMLTSPLSSGLYTSHCSPVIAAMIHNHAVSFIFLNREDFSNSNKESWCNGNICTKGLCLFNTYKLLVRSQPTHFF